MKSLNLMPAPRRQAKACRARLRQWAAVVAAFAAMLVVICVTCHRTWGVGPEPRSDELDQMTDRIGNSGRTIRELQQQLAASRWKLDAFRGVGQQPDWSVLLTLLADGLGNDVVLKSCRLDEIMIPLGVAADKNSRAKLPATKVASEPRHKIAFVLNIAGFGRSQTAVSQFVLRLERSGMFDGVRLVSTIREPFLNAKAIAFRLECELEGISATPRRIE